MRIGSKRAVAGVVAGVAVLAGAGAALAHGGPGGFGFGGGSQTDVLNAVAKNVGVSNKALRTAIKDALAAQVDQQVKDGVLTKAQGDAIKTRIDGGTVHVDVGPAGMGPGGLGAVEAASSYLGMTAADIRTALAGGKSLADLATAKGKTAAGLQDAIVADATAKLAASVAAGDLTDAQRDTILAQLKSNVAAIVAQTGGAGHMGPGAGPPGMHGSGFGQAMHRR